jgi:hypothetical protein
MISFFLIKVPDTMLMTDDIVERAWMELSSGNPGIIFGACTT